MEIVNIMQGTNLGGTEQASFRLMLSLKKLGHDLEVISLNPVGALGKLLEREGINAKGLEYRGKGGWRNYRSLKKLLRLVDAEALLMTGPHLLTMVAMGSLCEGRRILAVHFHHTGVKPAWQWRLIYRIACRRFHAITFPSDFIRKEAEALYPPVSAIARTVRNPLTVPPLSSLGNRERARAELGLPDGVPIVGNAGWLIPRKRFDVFLRVAQLVAAAVPEALFVIAGDGDERGALEALAHELGIACRVRWLGWQTDLGPFYQSLDVMLFNSDWDAMGLAPLEAMSHAVPLVASVEHGGLKEIVDSDNYGFLINTHDVVEMSEKVIYLLRHPNEARVIALAGRERVKEVSDPEVHAEIMQSLLLRTSANGSERS